MSKKFRDISQILDTMAIVGEVIITGDIKTEDIIIIIIIICEQSNKKKKKKKKNKIINKKKKKSNNVIVFIHIPFIILIRFIVFLDIIDKSLIAWFFLIF